MTERFSPIDNEVEASPVQVLSEVWEHALVDEQTRSHRREGQEVLRKLLHGRSVSQEDYAAFPVKAAILGAEPGVRYSFGLLLLNYEKEKKLKGALPDAPDLDLDITYAVTPGNLFGHHIVGHEVFLTPDEYVAGNLEAVRRIRRKSVKGHKFGQLWSGRQGMQEYFRERYAEYGLNAKETSNRYQRFERKLVSRAYEEDDPRLFMDTFVTSRRELRLPTVSSFRDYLLSHDGKLEIHMLGQM